MAEVLRPPTPACGRAPPWPDVAELAEAVPPDAFGALILKAAAHLTDGRDRERHLADAAVLLACVDPFADRTSSGSDRKRLLHLQRHLADPTAAPWLLCS